MTKPINLYLLSRIRQEAAFNHVFRHASNKNSGSKTPIHEIESLRHLSDRLLAAGVTVPELDGFFMGYSIPQIGKEFDLLKFGPVGCLNIELKSQPVPLEQIRAQLLKNRHYLAHLGRQMHLFTFVADTRECYRLLPEDVLEPISPDVLAEAVHAFATDYVQEIDGMFRASEYLVSPSGTPEKFLCGEYFLTQAQDQVRQALLSAINDTTGTAFFSLTGRPGTGKTLLLYDVGRALGPHARTAIIHWGELEDGHHAINGAGHGLTILPRSVLDTAGGNDGGSPTAGDGPATDSHSASSDHHAAGDGSAAVSHSTSSDHHAAGDDILKTLAPYSYLLIDESHRLSLSGFQAICRTAVQYHQRVVFCLDPEQILTTAERENDIAGRIKQLPPTEELLLSEHLRGNRELQAFIRQVRDLRDVPKDHLRYENVDLGFASNVAEARKQLAYYRDQGYVFINYARSVPETHGTEADCEESISTAAIPDNAGPFMEFEGGYDVNHVIGQEFDRIVMLLDTSFFYDADGRLEGVPHLDPDVLYPNLFYQGVTRVQEKLALIVLENDILFDTISQILEDPTSVLPAGARND